MSYLQPAGPTIELGINIDHVATLRNARGTAYPDPMRAALEAEQAGADVITLHLREDRRHIRDADVRAIRPVLTTRMNLEAAVTREMLDFACEIKPQDVCLVPEKRTEVTTEGGLDVVGHFSDVQAAIRQLQAEGIRVSLFIDPDAQQIKAAAEAGAPVIELHTGRYADAHDAREQADELQRIQASVLEGIKQGLKVNAGHGLHYTNVQAIAAIPQIAELNIGHAVVAQAVFVGWHRAVADMKAIMVKARLAALANLGKAEGCWQMIYGIGTDILKIPRVEAALARHGDRFAQRILGPQEMQKYLRRKAKVEARGVRFLATRFAAKEAFSKAIGMGMRMPMTWRAMQVLNAPSGKPEVVCSGSLKDWMEQHGLTAQVSITDEAEYAVAFVIVEKS